jgi:ribulose-5-phosphate 4-epimerase/fuculose-1-phosphate aldolase
MTTTQISRPSKQSLFPELHPRAELAVLARALNHDGYNEHDGGHISYKQPDGTLLVTPRGMAWDEVCASDIMHIDIDGNILDGMRDIVPSLEIHYAIHRHRNAGVVIHQHPQWCTVWACSGRIPPIYDQTSAFGGDLNLVAEYDGEFASKDVATRTLALIGDANAVLLANHGVLIVGENIRQAHQRAVAIEWRCQIAWRVETLCGEAAVPLAPELVSGLQASQDRKGGYQPNLFNAMARREIRRDSSVLD